ncbi:ATP-dependent DNA ligase [Leifsonia xyli]|uniref:DUF7882 family protein n=1 Tax=Leifsonia xyli TaxID=1575 RepID=UPI0007CDD1C1|nr:ATP-dependent DNA ligase [Leifsonia xyli]
MGFMVYDSSTQISFDDRVLAHLEVVIVSKLRRKESFALSWRESPDNGDGRTTVWIDPSIPLRFRYNGSRPPALDREWIERLAAAAASSTGLIAVDEDGQQAVGSTHERGL